MGKIRTIFFIIFPIVLALNIELSAEGTTPPSAPKGALSEGFESATFPPNGWTTINNDGGFKEWSRSTSEPHTGNANASVSDERPNDDWLITPRLTVAAGDHFSLWAKSSSSSYPEDFNVKVSKSGNSVADFTITLQAVRGVPSSYTQYTYDLVGGGYGINAGDNIYIAIQCVSNDKYTLNIDDVAGPALHSTSTQPGSPSNPSPADSSTSVALSGNLTWNFGANTDTYDLWFGHSGNMSKVVADGSAGASGSYSYSNLTEGSDYQWQVIAKNSGTGENTAGAIWSFRTTLPSGQFQIGRGTNAGQHLPIDPFFGYTYSQSLYFSSDFGSVGSDKRISKIYYNYHKSSTDNHHADDWVVYIGTTTATSVSDWTAVGSLTKVFDGNSGYGDIAPGDGWMEITLDMPFNYNPSTDGNLIVAVDENSGGYTSSGDKFYYDQNRAKADVSIYYYNDSTNPDPASPPTGGDYFGISSYYPNIRFQFEDIPTNPIFRVAPSSKDYGVVNLGESSSAQTFTISNRGGGTLTITSAPSLIGANPGDYSLTDGATYPKNLAAGQSYTIDVTFTPTVAGARNATLRIVDNQKSNHDVALSGTGKGPVFDVNPSSKDYGSVNLGESSAAQTFTISNKGGGTLTINPAPSLIGANSGDYSITDGATYPKNLTAGQSYTINVTFTPTAAGTRNATLRIVDNQKSNQDVALSGTGKGATFDVNPSSKDYGTVNLGESSAEQTFTVTNTGGETLTISSAPTITGTNTGDYSITTDANSYPVNLTNGQTAGWGVTFSPQAEGARSANLTFTDNTKATHNVALSGSGHNATLTPPFTENFTNYLPTDWTEGTGTLAAPSTISGTSSAWTQDDYRNDTGDSNGKSAKINIYGTSKKDWLFTPSIDLSGKTNYQLEFDLALTDNGNSGNPDPAAGDDDKFAVIISTDNGSTWSSANALQIWNNATNPSFADIPSGGQHITLDLTSYSGTVKIGFYGESTVSNGDMDLFVDNVQVREIPTSPIFSVSPSSKDYGTVNLTESSAQTFTIKNTGIGTIQITGSSLTGTNASEFSLTDGNSYPVNLAANESIAVSVTFSPTSRGQKTASLQITDGAKATHSVALSGRGKNVNHGGDGSLYGGYYYANSTSNGGTNRPAYSWIDPTAKAHTEITSWTSGGDDDGYYNAAIGFSFTFFGNAYTDCYIGSNGVIAFGSGYSGGGSSVAIPNTDDPDNIIAGCLMDLDDLNDGKVYYGADAGGNFVVTWYHYHDYGDDNEWITFQIILKQNGNIKIQFNTAESSLNAEVSGTTINGDALIGIENSDGSDGFEYRNNGSGGPIFDPGKAGNLALEMSKNEGATPVELSSFTANMVGGNVELNWRTETEVNVYSFQIERAPVNNEATENSWTMIGEVMASGNSNSPKQYSFVDNKINPGAYEYKLKIIDTDGSFKYSDIVEVNLNSDLPEKFALGQNYPNPFNPTTNITYVIARSEATRQSHELSVKLMVYNILGRKVATLVNKKQVPGNYSVQFDASKLSSGIYFYRLTAGEFSSVKKMILMK